MYKFSWRIEYPGMDSVKWKFDGNEPRMIVGNLRPRRLIKDLEFQREITKDKDEMRFSLLE